MRDMIDFDRRRKKWVWGCTGGCFGFLVAVAALGYLGLRLLGQAVPLVPPEAFLPPDAGGFLFVRVEADDPLMVETAVRLLMLPAVQEAARDRLGQELRIEAEVARSAVSSAAPVQGVAVLRKRPDQEGLDGGLVLSTHRWSRFYRRVLAAAMKRMTDAGATRSEHKHAVMVVTERGTAVAVRTNNFMWAGRRELADYWIDRLEERRALEAGAGEAGAPVAKITADGTLRAAYERLDGDQAVRFACVNARGELAALLAMMPEGRVRELLEASGMTAPEVVSLSGQMASLNSMDAVLTLFVECADPDATQRLSEALAALAEELGPASPFGEVKVERESDTVLRVEAHVENVPKWAAGLVTHLADRQTEAAE